MRTQDDRFAPSSPPLGLWPLALGLTGFAAGFFGPILLNPDANQGPLLGLFITGPGGALGGLVLGVVVRVLPISDAARRRSLLSACAAFGIGTLYFCLPAPAVLGYVIDAEVIECAPPREFAEEATLTWQTAVDRTTWYTPPAHWKQTAWRNVDTAAGLVLTMRIARRAAIYRHRKPWSFGRKTAGPWQAVDTPERYYAAEEGADCASHLERPRQLYMPFVEQPANPDAPTKAWPPTDITSFLRLMELGPVPDEYQRLLVP